MKLSVDEEEKETADNNSTRLNRLLIAKGLGVLFGFTVIAWCTYSLFFAGVNPGPTFVDEIRVGKFTEADIKSIEILKFDPGAGWPFTESEYSQKASKRLGPAATKQLIGLLRTSSTEGHKHRNHPATFYYGIFRINMVQGGHFYVFYHLGYYDKRYYVYLDANSKNSTNPNGADAYENIPLADFLKRNDPWYRDIDSPMIQQRASFPDHLP
ncbi:hypothetical protein ACYFX5_00500 [Bremerella sp. T1]|uniref:hypothetical protein n=1 Tax=Bremerella sp. TYQ1 TaxID=3119568 RepID=UPI001CCFE516|nr:hypothetical protein [Bremerella volcania]UBM36770.1 hypothetical protein LA756_02460 [Bremerella volcania]